MGYFEPVGGYLRSVSDNVVIHGCPFNRTTLPIGSTSVAIKLNAPDNPIVITNPTNYGLECEAMLSKLTSNGSRPNVKYLAALNQMHHLALKSWIDEFPDAKVIGVDGLPEKKASEGIQFDYLFTAESITPQQVGLPKEFTDEFEMVYFPAAVFHELVLFHNSSVTMITADLLFNLPAHDQYSDYWSFEAPMWYSLLGYFLQGPMKFFSINSYIVRAFARHAATSGTSRDCIDKMLAWPITRIVVCHGDVIEGSIAKQRILDIFGPLVDSP